MPNSDPPLNSPFVIPAPLLISDPRQHALFDEIIARLDVPADPNTGHEVVFLKHAAAKEVATLLCQVVAGLRTAAPPAARRPAYSAGCSFTATIRSAAICSSSARTRSSRASAGARMRTRA